MNESSKASSDATKPICVNVPSNLHGVRLDKALTDLLKAEFPSISRSQVQTWIESQCVTQDEARLKPVVSASQSVAAGTRYWIVPPSVRQLDLTPWDYPIPVLYEDEHLIIVKKPAGMSVHPSDSDPDRTLVHALLFQVKSLSAIAGVERPGIVHRIDKWTTGSLVVAKSDMAHQRLVEMFQAHDLEREYRAFVFGAPHWIPPVHRIETQIGRHPTDRKRMAVIPKGGKTAVSYFELLNSESGISLIRARLETGRTHQVRVHLSSMGFPLLGDPLYPASSHQKRAISKELESWICALPGQLLHARTLGFKHPITGHPIHVVAPFPAIWTELETKISCPLT